MTSRTPEEARLIQLEDFTNRLVVAAKTTRIPSFPESFGRPERQYVLDLLRQRGELDTIEINIERFADLITVDDFRQLLSRGRLSGVERAFRCTSAELQKKIRDLLVEEKIFEAIAKILGTGKGLVLSLGFSRCKLPSAFICPMIEAGYSEQVARNLNQFEDEGLGSEEAIALIEKGFGQEFVGRLQGFAGLNQAVADALLAEHSSNLQRIGYNLRRFVGLSAALKQKLIDTGCAAEVSKNPQAFVV